MTSDSPTRRKRRSLLESYPLASFDPRYRDIWLRAATEVIPIEFASPNEAKAFQTRLQLYRAVAREAKLPEADLFYRAKTTRKGTLLLLGPSDARYDSLLSQLVAAPLAQPAPLENLPDVDPDDLDAFVLNATETETKGDF